MTEPNIVDSSTTLPNNRRKAVIAMGGAFSPMHLGHVAALESTAQALEAQFDIVAMYFAPAPDGYCRAKQKRRKQQQQQDAAAVQTSPVLPGIASTHRLAILRASTSLSNYTIAPPSRTYGSAQECLQHECLQKDEANDKNDDNNLDGNNKMLRIIVMGSDKKTPKRLEKLQRESSVTEKQPPFLVAFVNRYESNSDNDTDDKDIQTDYSTISQGYISIDLPVQATTASVSSSGIRSLLCEHNDDQSCNKNNPHCEICIKEKGLESAVHNHWLSADAAEYIRQHYQDDDFWLHE